MRSARCTPRLVVVRLVVASRGVAAARRGRPVAALRRADVVRRDPAADRARSERRYHDALVQRWELALFGAQPSHTLAGAMPVLGVSELLHLRVSRVLPGDLRPAAAAFFVREKRRALAETVLALTITYTVCWVIFVLFPVEGPRYVWGAPPDVPDGPMRRLTVHILAAGSARGAAFPSSHMAVMVVQMVMAFRWQRRVGWS